MHAIMALLSRTRIKIKMGKKITFFKLYIWGVGMREVAKWWDTPLPLHRGIELSCGN
jgi:hypothetical protein